VATLCLCGELLEAERESAPVDEVDSGVDWPTQVVQGALGQEGLGRLLRWRGGRVLKVDEELRHGKPGMGLDYLEEGKLRRNTTDRRCIVREPIDKALSRIYTRNQISNSILCFP